MRFAIHYNGYWIDNAEGNFNLEIYIVNETENIEIWDLADTEYTESRVTELTMLDLTEYINGQSTLKLAFKYSGNNGDSVVLDNIQLFPNNAHNDYSLAQTDYEWIEISTNPNAEKAELLPWGDIEAEDEGYFTYNFTDFEFPYFSETFRSFSVLSNGVITFDSVAHIEEFGGFTGNSSVLLPSSEYLNNYLALFQKDMIFCLSGDEVGIFILEDIENDRLIVEYNKINNYTSPLNSNQDIFNTFQVIFYSNGQIKMQYKDIKDDYVMTFPSSTPIDIAVNVGFENQNGTKGIAVFNGGDITGPQLKEEEAYMFTPKFDTTPNAEHDVANDLIKFNLTDVTKLENFQIVNTGITTWQGELEIEGEIGSFFISNAAGNEENTEKDILVRAGESNIIYVKYKKEGSLDYIPHNAVLKIKSKDSYGNYESEISLKIGTVSYNASTLSFTVAGAGEDASANDYNMISLPGNYSNSAVSELLSIMGSYDNTQWRLFAYSNGAYNEYVSAAKSFSSINTGEGYFILSREAKQVSLPAGTTPDLSENYTIELEAGRWNIVGNPFSFDISIADIQAANPAINFDTDVSAFYGYSAGNYSVTTDLRAYKGYFIKNDTDTAITLNIPPMPKPSLLAKENCVSRVAINASIESSTEKYGMIQLVADKGFNGSLEKDTLPPYISEKAIKLSTENGKAIAINGFNGTNTQWKIKAENMPKGLVSLNLSSIDMPENYKIKVIDNVENKAFILDGTSYSFINCDENGSRDFDIVLGTTEYFAADEGVNAKYALAAYPNPFNPVTTINLELAQTQDVKIDIFNVMGRLVKTIEQKDAEAGTHKFVWNGKDNSDKSVATGVYFLKVKLGAEYKTQKLLLVK